MSKVLVLMVALICISATASAPSWVQVLHTNYNNQGEYVDYWYNSSAMLNYECVYGIDQEVILAKLWLETNGTLTGAGRWGAGFGIKGKAKTGKSIKGFDSKEKKLRNGGKVEYIPYGAPWEMISGFCKFIKKPLYASRFDAWKQKYPDMPDWYNYLLALQVHPNRNKSELAYASCGCEAEKGKMISKTCYNKRKAHAQKGINWVLKNLR